MLATKVSITARYHLRGKSPTILLGFTPSTRNCALVKTIPGWEYDPKVKRWYIPFTHAAVRNLLERFPGVQVDRHVAWIAQALPEMDLAVTQRRVNEWPMPIFKMRPWQHQLWAYNFARSLPYALIGADMGVGKSRILIDLIVNMQFQRSLIICPKGVLTVWPDEFKKHCAIPIHLIVFPENATIEQKVEIARQALCNSSTLPRVLIVNYDSVWRAPFGPAYETVENDKGEKEQRLVDLGFILNEYKPDMIACDEAHRLAGVSSKVSKFAEELGKTGAWKAALTGTPMTQHPGTVYGIARFLDAGIFGPWWQFEKDYAIKGGYAVNGRAVQILGWRNQQDLERRLDRIMFRVKSEEVQDLPELVEVYRTCTLSAEAAKIYKSMYTWAISNLPDDLIMSAKIVLTKFLRLQQLTGGWATPDQDDPDSPVSPIQVDTSKAELLKEILEDLTEDEPIVVFCRFTKDIESVRQVAKDLGRGVLEFSGRIKQLKEWQDAQASILAVQVASGAEGISLVRAKYAIYYSLPLSLSQYQQSLKRLHRPGQVNNVTVIHLLAELPNGKKTVDREVYQALISKRQVIDQILELIGK